MKPTRATPGPWHVASVILRDLPAHTALAVWDETHGQAPDSITGRPICILTPLEKMNPMDEANARLIAAAPDLLFALKRIVTELPAKRDWLDPEIEAFAKDAIAKATQPESGNENRGGKEGK